MNFQTAEPVATRASGFLKNLHNIAAGPIGSFGQWASAMVLVSTSALLLNGCSVAQIAVEASRESAKDISVTTASGYDSSVVSNYETVAIFVKSVGRTDGAAQFTGFGFGATGGSSAEVLQSRLSTVLIREGFDVLEAGDVARLATDEEAERPTERTILRLSRQAGSDALVIGIAEAGSQMKFGLFGLGSGVEAGIVSTVIKVMDADSGRTIAIASAEYKEPKTASEIIDDLSPFVQKIMRGEAEDVRQTRDSLI